MSDGRHGMLKGQAPDEFQRVDPTMPKRSAYDTEHERKPIKPMKSHADSTGFTSKVAGLAQDGIMEQAIQDRLTQSVQDGIRDGYEARTAEEAMKKEAVDDAEIDRREDKATCDDDDDLMALRARRRQQMKDAHDKRLKYQGLGHGTYDHIDEEVFLKTVTSSERAVVHFYHKSFERCKIMDMHLERCAKKFFGTRFVKMDAEKAPFFVEKLAIRTLPCVVVFKDGVALGRQVGFEGITDGGEEFDTVALAWRIKEWQGIEEEFGPEDVIEW